MERRSRNWFEQSTSDCAFAHRLLDLCQLVGGELLQTGLEKHSCEASVVTPSSLQSRRDLISRLPLDGILHFAGSGTPGLCEARKGKQTPSRAAIADTWPHVRGKRLEV